MERRQLVARLTVIVLQRTQRLVRLIQLRLQRRNRARRAMVLPLHRMVLRAQRDQLVLGVVGLGLLEEQPLLLRVRLREGARAVVSNDGTRASGGAGVGWAAAWSVGWAA